MSISLRTEKLKGEPSHPIEDEEQKKMLAFNRNVTT